MRDQGVAADQREPGEESAAPYRRQATAHLEQPTRTFAGWRTCWGAVSIEPTVSPRRANRACGLHACSRGIRPIVPRLPRGANVGFGVWALSDCYCMICADPQDFVIYREYLPKPAIFDCHRLDASPGNAGILKSAKEEHSSEKSARLLKSQGKRMILVPVKPSEITPKTARLDLMTRSNALAWRRL